ncbi:MAG TPA: hypothetical protein ENI15_16250 [Spirochaetes bacterium]|nr:hypothetical protein [Spirochaetota bacterium]
MKLEHPDSRALLDYETPFQLLIATILAAQCTDDRDPDKIEKDLCELISEKDRTPFSYAVNFHGRYTCKALGPLCPNCVVEKLCPFPDKTRAFR